MNFINDIGTLLTQPVLNADAYKSSHHSFEHPEFQREYAYIEARKGGAFTEVQFFGLQYVLKYYMTQQITYDMLDEAEYELTTLGVPFDRAMFKRVIDVHDGYFPVRISALPEGIIVPQGTVLVTIESTDPECPGLAAYVETLLLRGVWFPTTIATRSMRWWRLIDRYLELSGDPALSEWKMVDFGARGVTSTESAGIAGMAHLVNHQVTDNLMGVRFAKHAYNTTGMPGYSIPATEHSVTTSWGEENEMAFFKNILKVHGQGGSDDPRKPVSVVIDTYDQDQAVGMWLRTAEDGGLLNDLINSRMQLVLRPDSGDPIINVVHLLDLVGSYTGWHVNEKGFRVLPDYVRIIQGDGINEDTLRRILQRVTYHTWSIDNITFGSGGGLLVHEIERDTHRFAMKASEVVIGGMTHAIQKKPKTDLSKSSKAGRFAVVLQHDGSFTTMEPGKLTAMDLNILRPVFETGKFIKQVTFEEVREASRQCRKVAYAPSA